ncbi:hypothetical protein VRK_15570 [Vibrio sp. MEBiC08052]|nr:hypothetical protein VRK_15570 [Vibrio sp. MEBiC08052]
MRSISHVEIFNKYFQIWNDYFMWLIFIEKFCLTIVQQMFA